jgi:hypothetical protein
MVSTVAGGILGWTYYKLISQLYEWLNYPRSAAILPSFFACLSALLHIPF